MKYRGIVLLRDERHPVKTCCRLLKVSFSGFYSWLKEIPSKREQEDEELKSKMKDIFDNSKETYGVPRIQHSLRREGEFIGKKRVARLMKEKGLEVRMKKAFRPKTTINNPSDIKSPRVYKRESHEVSGPNQVWVSDLTYIPTEIEGFVYLVAVMDLFNRKIRGWDVSASMEAKHTKNALMNAIRTTPGKLDLNLSQRSRESELFRGCSWKTSIHGYHAIHV